jgi:hypothetical protein
MYLKITVSVVRFRPWAPSLKAMKYNDNSERSGRDQGETSREQVSAR